jgi:hypothetical protein
MSPRPTATMTMTAQSNSAAAEGAADWLRLAAAPTFAVMALLIGVLGSGRRTCSARLRKLRHR